MSYDDTVTNRHLQRIAEAVEKLALLEENRLRNRLDLLDDEDWERWMDNE